MQQGHTANLLKQLGVAIETPSKKDANMYFTCFFSRILILYLLGVATTSG